MVGATIRAQEPTETAEAALKVSEDRERELRIVADFREMFLGIVGHDLRNPLATIVMTAEALRLSGHLDALEQRAVARIVASSARMSKMVLQLLDFTRVRLGGGFPIEPRPTDLREMCRSLVEEFGAAVHLDVEGEVTGTWYRNRLAEALSNIAGNAVEHAQAGTTVLVKARSKARMLSSKSRTRESRSLRKCSPSSSSPSGGLRASDRRAGISASASTSPNRSCSPAGAASTGGQRAARRPSRCVSPVTSRPPAHSSSRRLSSRRLVRRLLHRQNLSDS